MSTNVHTFTRNIGTSRKRISLTATARETLQAAGFTKLTEVDIATGGQFSIIDAIEAVLEITGPAEVTLATWTAAEFDLTQIEKQLTTGAITNLRMIVDRSFVSRQPGFVKKIHDRFGENAVRSTRTHAKFVVIKNNEWSVTMRTSMNLNHNARLEYLQVTEDPELSDFWLSIADSIFETNNPGLENKRGVPEFEGLELLEPPVFVKMGSQPQTGTRPRIGAA